MWISAGRNADPCLRLREMYVTLRKTVVFVHVSKASAESASYT